MHEAAPLSWKLRKSLDDEQNQLFYNQVQTYYEIEGYFCACGHEQILICSPYQEDYQCPVCQNKLFYDANLAHCSFEHFCFLNPEVNLDYDFEVMMFEDHIASCYQTVLPIPKTIDFVRNTMRSETIQLFSFILYKDGDKKIDHCIGFDYGLLSKLKKNLDHYIHTHSEQFDLPPLGDKIQLTRNILALFWGHPWLKEIDFHLWEDVDQLPKSDQTIKSALGYILKDRHEKSIKKALYENYLLQIQEHGYFKTSLINPILATFSDANHIVKLLSLSLSNRNITPHEEPFVLKWILFLKRYYTEKQIAKAIVQIEDNYIFSDMLRDFIDTADVLENYFQKPKCSLNNLHNEMVRCSQIKRYNELSDKDIYYTQGQEMACARVMGYHVRLPQSGEELYRWAKDLHNCVSGYFEQILNQFTTVYGFFYEDCIVFAAEVIDKNIIQASGIGNSSLDEQQKEVLTTWFHRFILEKESLPQH